MTSGAISVRCSRFAGSAAGAVTNDGASFSGQIIGALTIFGWVFVTSFVAFFVIKMVWSWVPRRNTKVRPQRVRDGGLSRVRQVITLSSGSLGPQGPFFCPGQETALCRKSAISATRPPRVWCEAVWDSAMLASYASVPPSMSSMCNLRKGSATESSMVRGTRNKSVKQSRRSGTNQSTGRDRHAGVFGTITHYCEAESSEEEVGIHQSILIQISCADAYHLLCLVGARRIAKNSRAIIIRASRTGMPL